MRPITRTIVGGLLVVLPVLPAPGALPSLPRSSDPYCLLATHANASGGLPEPVDAYRARCPDAVPDGAAFVSYEGERCRLVVVQP